MGIVYRNQRSLGFEGEIINWHSGNGSPFLIFTHVSSSASHISNFSPNDALSENAFSLIAVRHDYVI